MAQCLPVSLSLEDVFGIFGVGIFVYGQNNWGA
jgi:hypothetical protein